MSRAVVQGMGLRTSSLSKSGPFDGDRLCCLREAGLQVAELSFNYAHGGVTFDDRGRAAELRGRAEELGLTLVAHAPNQYWLSNPDLGEVRETARQVEAVVDGAEAYGAQAMVIHACPGKPVIAGREGAQMEGLVWALERLARRCEAAGVRLAVETMVPGRLTSSVARLAKAVDRVGSPWVGICLDTNHANLSHGLDDVVRQAGARIVEFHVNDNHGVKEEHLIPYEGGIDWASFAGAVADTGCTSYMVMEPGGHYEEEGEVLARAGDAAARLRAEMAAAGVEAA